MAITEESAARQRFPIPGIRLLSFSRSDMSMKIVRRAIALLHGHNR
ncbi:hypothetical protein [Nocardia sp. NBC_01388]